MRAHRTGLVLTTCLLFTFAAFAETQTETEKLLPAGVATNDAFGRHVTLGGPLGLVSAVFDDDRGNNAGAAYAFDAASGALIEKLFATDPPGSDPRREDTFGTWGAIHEDRFLVGAPQKDQDGRQSGAAYLLDAATLDPILRLLPFSLDPRFDTTGSAFGASLDLNDDYILVGAPGDLDFSNFGGGAAYLFRNDAGATLIEKFSSDDVGPGDNFGRRVALADDVAVSAVPFDDDQGEDAGAIYLFAPETALQLQKLIADDGAAGDLFGIGLAADGNTIAVGASEHDANGGNSGAVYLFDAHSGMLLHKIVPDDASPGARFGRAVDLDGDRLVVGAPFDQDVGAAYVFDIPSGMQQLKLIASDGEIGDVFGISVAISGSRVLVGAEGDDDNGDLAGSAYRFQLPVDSDSDGFLDAEDCAPDDAQTWRTPGPVTGLTLAAAGEFAWQEPDQPGGVEVLYDLLRSTDPADFAAATCLESGETDRVAFDGQTPPSDVLWSFLVRSRNACGATLGNDSEGLPRSGANCP